MIIDSLRPLVPVRAYAVHGHGVRRTRSHERAGQLSGAARADGRDADPRARRAERRGAAGDGARAAPSLRSRRRAAVRVRRSSAADRPRADHLAALHRRLHDRGAAARRRRTRCSKSEPAPATRPRCSPRSPSRCTASRSFPISPRRARRALAQAGYRNVEVRTGNGYLGWPERAPFDRIIVTAAPPEIPQALVDQLAVGGIMVVPVGHRLSGDGDRHEDAGRRHPEAHDRSAVRADGVEARELG